MKKIKVGISACLLGEAVRYNGGHKRFALATDELSQFFEFVSTCPEVGAGMGIPRTPIRLFGDARAPRAMQVESPHHDYTDSLASYAAERIPALQDLCGYIFIKNSPSCGLFRVKIYSNNDRPGPEMGRGLFAAALTNAMPLLPVEEDTRLQDPVLRENFVTRVYAMQYWRVLCEQGLTAAGLIELHSRYKYTLMAHAPQQLAALGQLLADAGNHDPAQLGPRYFAALMQALQQKATRKTNTNVLMHLQGYLKRSLSTDEKSMLTQAIDQYRRGVVALVVPISVLKHFFRLFPDPYIARQTFLEPYPEELGLRNSL